MVALLAYGVDLEDVYAKFFTRMCRINRQTQKLECPLLVLLILNTGNMGIISFIIRDGLISL